MLSILEKAHWRGATSAVVPGFIPITIPLGGWFDHHRVWFYRNWDATATLMDTPIQFMRNNSLVLELPQEYGFNNATPPRPSFRFPVAGGANEFTANMLGVYVATGGTYFAVGPGDVNTSPVDAVQLQIRSRAFTGGTYFEFGIMIHSWRHDQTDVGLVHHD